MITEKDIISAFKTADIPFDKIVKSKLGGFYVYTPYGMEDSYFKYTKVEEGYGWVKKLKEKVVVKRCFIDDEDMLNMSIAECKTRKKYSTI